MSPISCHIQVQGFRNTPGSQQSVHTQQSPTHVAVPHSPSAGLYWFEPDTREGGAVGLRRWLDKPPPPKKIKSSSQQAQQQFCCDTNLYDFFPSNKQQREELFQTHTAASHDLIRCQKDWTGLVLIRENRIFSPGSKSLLGFRLRFYCTQGKLCIIFTFVLHVLPEGKDLLVI